jgi:hypothetical protein
VFALSALEERMTHLETELAEMQGTVVRLPTRDLGSIRRLGVSTVLLTLAWAQWSGEDVSVTLFPPRHG